MYTCLLLFQWGTSPAICLPARCYSSGVEWSDMSTCPLLFQLGSSVVTCLPAVYYSSEVVVERHVFLLAVIPVGLQWSDMSTCPLLFQ